MRSFHCSYHQLKNEEGEEEVSYTYQLTLIRKLLCQRREVKTYNRSPDGQWFHKFIANYPTTIEEREIAEVIEFHRQQSKYRFYLQHVFI